MPKIAAPGDHRAQNTSMMALTSSPQRFFGVLREVRGSGPNMDAMKSAVGDAVRNCPSSSCRDLPLVALAVINGWLECNVKHFFAPVTIFTFVSYLPAKKTIAKPRALPVKPISMPQPLTWNSNLVWNAPGAAGKDVFEDGAVGVPGVWLPQERLEGHGDRHDQASEIRFNPGMPSK